MEKVDIDYSHDQANAWLDSCLYNTPYGMQLGEDKYIDSELRVRGLKLVKYVTMDNIALVHRVIAEKMSSPNIPESSSTSQDVLDRLAARQAMRDNNLPKATRVHSSSVYFDWSWKGCGFGQLALNFDIESGTVVCDNECMSRDSVRKILHAYADFIADRCIMSDNPEDKPLIDLAAEMKVYDELDEALINNGRTPDVE